VRMLGVCSVSRISSRCWSGAEHQPRQHHGIAERNTGDRHHAELTGRYHTDSQSHDADARSHDSDTRIYNDYSGSDDHHA
jgi:hypothetical protein